MRPRIDTPLSTSLTLFMKKSLAVSSIVFLLNGCGGGGSGNDVPIGPPTGPVAPAPPVLASINAADAFSKFINTNQDGVDLPSNDGFLGTANLIIRTEESYPFVTDGVAQETRTSQVIQFQRRGADGRLQRQNIWKIHFDAQMKPIGIAVGKEYGHYTDCLAVKSSAALPPSTNGSGVLLSGLQSSTYLEGFKNGKFAHYCSPATQTSGSVEWSVVEGAPNPYFCLTMPEGMTAPKTRICTPVDKAGALNQSAWVRVYNSDGTSQVDFKNTRVNKPVETFSTVINAKDYWYGAVWRPQDGYVYKAYPDTRFSSELACREQTDINWKENWSANNIGWACIHSISN